MRIADNMRYEIFKYNLGSLKEMIDKAQTTIASGKKILQPSDDPVAASTGIQFKAEQSINSQYRKNLEQLKTLGSFYDTSIEKIHDLLLEAKQVAITQSSATMNASTRTSAAEDIKGIIEHLVTIGNTKVGNNHIFGGKKTNFIPFTMDNNYNVTFNGTSDVSSVYIDANTQEDLGISGQRVFISGSNIFDVLRDFKVALEGNDPDNIKQAIENINQSLDNTETNLAYAGTYVNRVESLIADKDSKNQDLTEILSKMTETDIAQAVSDFNSLTTAYQAMLYSMSKIQELNILNYLR